MIDDQIYIKKNCEYCGKEFSIIYKQREISYCSQKCGVYGTSKQKGENNKQLQLQIYSDLKFRLNRDPLLDEWEE
jgi:hypothetical protein